MNSIRLPLMAIVLFLSFFASAKEITDTLYSANKDRVIVTYNITRKGDKVDLQFKSVRKQFCRYLRDKYNETDKIHLLFFDRIGVSKDMEFTGEITPSPISLPAKASYKSSRDCFFVVEQRPSLSFELEATETGSFTIPLYLAHYEKKQHYKLLCSCGKLEVNIPKATAAARAKTSSQSAKPERNEQTQQVEFEVLGDSEDFSEYDDEALSLINSINRRLPEQDNLPMESTLERKIENLVDLQAKVKNEGTAKMIDEVLEAYNNKKRELGLKNVEIEKQKADDEAFNMCRTKEDYEFYQKQHPEGRYVEEAKAKITELEAKEKEEKDNQRKRTIWMIIGGVLLAILLFVGNQALQSFRSKRTQRSMMQMQQDAVNRAKTQAGNNAEQAINKQTNKIRSQAREKGKTIIRDTANKAKNIKGNKRVSI